MVDLRVGAIKSGQALQTYGSLLFGSQSFYDGFESTLVKWTKTDVGGVGAVARDATTSISGEASLKVNTAGAATNETYASVDFGGYPIDSTGKVRVSAFLRIGEAMAAAGDYVNFEFYYRNSVNSYPFRLRFLCTNANVYKLQYGSGAGYIDIVTTITSQTGAHWLFVEMDCDVNTDKIMSVSFGGVIYKINAAASSSSASALPWASVLFDVYTSAAAAKSAYIDEVNVRVII